MTRKTWLPIILSTGLFLVNVHGQSDRTEYVVTGVAVDDVGKPVSTAGVCLEPAAYVGGFDRFIECVGTDKNGAFRIAKSKINPASEYQLFVYDGTGNRALSTIEPPFDWVRQYDPTFNGRVVCFSDSSSIDLGKVRVQFWFSAVRVAFAGLFPEGSRRKTDWDGLTIRILARDGQTVFESGLSAEEANSERYIDRQRKDLMILLPEGRWVIQAVWDGCLRGQSEYFELKRKGGPTLVPLLPTSK